ncbi:hypothetical protein BJ165DRAFT_1503433 [Panaeolus papilionaceus]|nr:hypothetical protein BJ165DRAFT_1503433 [Panaeolus papilionaceus]
MKCWFSLYLHLLIFIFSPALLFSFDCSHIQFFFTEPISHPQLPPVSPLRSPAYQCDIDERIDEPEIEVEVGPAVRIVLVAYARDCEED